MALFAVTTWILDSRAFLTKSKLMPFSSPINSIKTSQPFILIRSKGLSHQSYLLISHILFLERFLAETPLIFIESDALELINIVPNPYYGYSGYETSQLDNRVKITNLPKISTIRIFTVNGTLIRTIKKSDDLTSVDWDLKNNDGIPVASGLYIIHVRTMIDGKKQNKILKWFGVLRPVDLDTF